MKNENTMMLSAVNAMQESYLSANPSTQDEKINILNAVMNPQHRVADYINLVINVKDVYAEIVMMDQKKKDDSGKLVETGEKVPTPRVILIDDKGEGYQCVSWGIYSALNKIMAFMGEPTWDTPLPLKVTQTQKGTNSILGLTVDTGKK